jgi:hypothetical protein
VPRPLHIALVLLADQLHHDWIVQYRRMIRQLMRRAANRHSERRLAGFASLHLSRV